MVKRDDRGLDKGYVFLVNWFKIFIKDAAFTQGAKVTKNKWQVCYTPLNFMTGVLDSPLWPSKFTANIKSN